MTEGEIAQGVDQQINYWISLPQIGSKEKLEQYQRKSITQIRQDLHDDFKNRQLVQRMQEQLVSNVKVSPAEVREYFNKMPQDSIPMIPTTVEVQILTQKPKRSRKKSTESRTNSATIPTELQRVRLRLRHSHDCIQRTRGRLVREVSWATWDVVCLILHLPLLLSI